MYASGFVVLVVLDVGSPKTAPDLNQDPSLRFAEPNKDDRWSVVILVLVWIESARKPKSRVVSDVTHAVIIRLVLNMKQEHPVDIKNGPMTSFSVII